MSSLLFQNSIRKLRSSRYGRGGSNSAGGTYEEYDENSFAHHKGRIGGYDDGRRDDNYAGDSVDRPRYETEGDRGHGSNASGTGTLPSEDTSSSFGTFFDSLFGASGPFSGIGNLIDSLAGHYLGTNLTGAQREANAWSAEQAALNRNFQSAEADKARQWQEEQYLQYNSPSALMRQYSEAGINPMLVAGGHMPSASTSTAAPAGSAPSSVAPSSMDIVSSIISILKSKAEIQNIKSDSNAKDAAAKASEAAAEASRARADRDIEGTRGDKILNDVNEKFAELTAGATYDKIIQEIDVLIEQGNTSRYERQVLGPLKAALYKAEARNLDSGALLNEWRKSYIDTYGADPTSNGLSQGMSALGTLVDRIIDKIRGSKDKPFKSPVPSEKRSSSGYYDHYGNND